MEQQHDDHGAMYSTAAATPSCSSTSTSYWLDSFPSDLSFSSGEMLDAEREKPTASAVGAVIHRRARAAVGAVRGGDPGLGTFGTAEAAAMAYDQAALSSRGAATALDFPLERVEESLRALGATATGMAGAGSPVLALKRRHSKRRRRGKAEIANDAATCRRSNMFVAMDTRFIVELEDLGADYLDELLRITCNTTY